jgi:hypothetical protein
MQRHQTTLFVGDTDLSLSVAAKTHAPDAFLIDHFNYKEYLISKPTQDVTAYTSLGDLPKNFEIFWNIAMSASRIVYVPPAEWSDRLTLDIIDPSCSVQGMTENLLLMVSNFCPVENLELCGLTANVNPLVDERKSDHPQLWISGCSVSHGVGIEPYQRYGQLVADSLTMPCSFLTKGGSSISWAADQILRSDIRPNDIVIWGITNTARMTFVHQNQLLTINTNTYQVNADIEEIFPLHLLLNHNTFYSHLYSIEQVINFCKKCQAKLMLIGVLPNNNMLRYLKTKSNYFHFMHHLSFSNNLIYDKYIDLGNDQKHPGIKQHKQYADFILKNI